MFYQNVNLPVKNLPVIALEEEQQSKLSQVLPDLLSRREGSCILALPGLASPGYREVAALAREIAAATQGRDVFLCLRQDMAKALGQALAGILGRSARILCIDRVKVGEESYLDIGVPVGPALPVVVKTLVMGK